MARRRNRSGARCQVPRACEAQRDRSGVLDDVPGHRMRTGSGVRLRSADGRPVCQQLALCVGPGRRRHRCHRIVPDDRGRVHEIVRHVRRAAARAAQHPGYDQDAQPHQGRGRVDEAQGRSAKERDGQGQSSRRSAQGRSAKERDGQGQASRRSAQGRGAKERDGQGQSSRRSAQGRSAKERDGQGQSSRRSAQGRSAKERDGRTQYSVDVQ